MEGTIVNNRSPQSRTRIFYGWVIVAAAFTIMLLGFGCAYTFSVFVQPLQRNFGASRGSISLIFSLAGFLYFALGAVSGPLAERWSTRSMSVGGMILTGLALVAAGLAQSLTGVYVAYGVGLGVGVGCAFVPSVGTVQRWFARRRAFASGLAVSGIGVGTLIMPPLASHLIGALGWRETYIVLGVATALLGGGAALLLKDDPVKLGTGPDGDPLVPRPTQNAQISGISLGDAVRSSQFFGLYVSCLIGSLGAFVPFVHLVPYAQGRGISAGAAVLLISEIGIGSTAGRFLLGNLADRMGRKQTLAAMYLGMGLASLIWALSAHEWSLVVFALIYGIFYGGWVAVLPSVVMDSFGARNVSSIIGVLYTSVALGTLIGPTAAGYAYDASHTYILTILGSAVANIAAAVVVRGTGAGLSQRGAYHRLR
jgi:MFS transporter, OFA family, oxalate/formate antiporter